MSALLHYNKAQRMPNLFTSGQGNISFIVRELQITHTAQHYGCKFEFIVRNICYTHNPGKTAIKKIKWDMGVLCREIRRPTKSD